jgi:hypothetical protein
MIKKGKLWLCMAFFASFWACSDDSENINEEITAEDVSNVTAIDEASITFTDAVTVANQVLTDEQVINGRIQQCYVVSNTETENQLLVTFESSCEGFDGKLRSGSFLIDWKGTLGAGNFSYTVTFDGYKVNGYVIAGSITVSGLTLKENGFGINVVVNDGVVNCPDGKQIIYEQDLDYDFNIGEVIQIRITGSSTGMGKEGNSYIANIKEPLLIQSDCEHAVSGSFDATFNGRPLVTVNYGDGSCDNKATASRGDLSIIFELE